MPIRDCLNGLVSIAAPLCSRISGMEKIALRAGQHHERVDGSGSPYHLRQDGLSIEVRIIKVADVFQALAQHRPYRESLPPEVILGILKKQAAQGILDAEIVSMVERNLQECWRVSMCQP